MGVAVRALRGICVVAGSGLAAALPQRVALADEPGRFLHGADGTQVMLYVSQPLGSGARAAPHFGLRVERLQAVQVVAGAPFALRLRHRYLVDLQFAPDRAPRLQFGGRYALGYAQGAFALEDADGRRALR